MDRKEIGDRIKQLLRAKKVTQGQVSEMTGITQSVISEIINGKRPPYQLVDKLANIYGISRDSLLAGCENTESQNSDNCDKCLTKDERIRLTEKLNSLYERHQHILQEAQEILKEVAAINKILIIDNNIG